MTQALARQDVRFEFGKNWKNFSSLLDERRILSADASVQKTLGIQDLSGKTFLDVGCGSGLFSLSAIRMGASVLSFDYDPLSVTCTTDLKHKYAPEHTGWTIQQGSILDDSYVQSLGTFDVAYSFGVLHQTGNLWKSLENIASIVKPGGMLYVSIGNDQDGASVIWTAIKRFYNHSPKILQWLILLISVGYFQIRFSVGQLLRRKNPFISYMTATKDRLRGMSPWHDLIDWVGGYPYEVASPDDVFSFFKKKGFELSYMQTCGGGIGCNEFVFRRH